LFNLNPAVAPSFKLESASTFNLLGWL
jgi:hypothetical protein